MTLRLRLYEFLATPAHAWLWLVSGLCGFSFEYQIQTRDETDMQTSALVELTPDLRRALEHLITSENTTDWTCPRCQRKYRDHEIDQADPCLEAGR